jgi:uncharacterized peroxidase-related enzyme
MPENETLGGLKFNVERDLPSSEASFSLSLPATETTMPHIALPESLPGISGLLAFRPETAAPLMQLADVLLHHAGSLSQGERELIATYVSSLNDCHFCQSSHGATAAAHFGNEQLILDVQRDFDSANISPKLKALLTIAGQVQKGGKNVTTEAVDRARTLGATDFQIHDTVLIAAAFCMYNRYVDGLATWAPQDPEAYRARGVHLATYGYVPTSERVSEAKTTGNAA